MTNAAPKAPVITDAEVWDLSAYFPSLDSDAFRTFRDQFAADVETLQKRAALLGPLTTETAPSWGEVIIQFEKLYPRISHMGSYLGCLTAANSRDEAAEKEQAALAVLGKEFGKIEILLLAAMRNADDAAVNALIGYGDLHEIRHDLRRKLWEARHSMDAELEKLAADLAIDSISAWGRLYNKIAGKLEFDFTNEKGEVERRPMAQRRALLEHPNAGVRKSAMEGSNKSWASMEDVAASCLNHIAGTRLTLYKRRGVDHFLDMALFDSSITHKTLEALFASIEECGDLAREALRLKAKALGMKKLGFQDISGPIPVKNDRVFTWTEAKQLILDAFAPYPRLAEYSAKAFKNRWVESELRSGKRPGAFCTSSYHIRESRVFMSYNGTIGDVMTLAHELGHAFHNEVLKEARPFARMYPMTLAETASTFAEAVLADMLLASPNVDKDMRRFLLDMQLERFATFILDITMRFYFEKEVYTKRSKGELSAADYCAMMKATQIKVFGDCLDPEQLDPYFWASKLHFYITGTSFYNFPYTFGYLFSRGLFARYREEKAAFFPRYEKALLLTGSASAEEVVRTALGADIEATGFWKDAIMSHESDVRQFAELV